MRFQGFIGPSYQTDSIAVNTQRCVNLYLEKNEVGFGKSGSVSYLKNTPGLILLNTIGDGPIRGSYKASNGSLFVVSGDKLYFVNSSWQATELGQLDSSTGSVDFADNGNTLVLVDGNDGYWHTFSSVKITKFTGLSWLGSNTVNYIDGYFLFCEPDTGKFYISNLNSVTLDALDFATAEGAPDNIVSAIVNHREVWLFGSDSIEVWYNSGNANFPFERIGGGFMEVGCVAPHSVEKIGKSIIWLGNDEQGQGIVYLAQGFMPQRISTHAVEQAIQSYGNMSDAKAYSYQENGHQFYVLNFTSANTTWVYDLTTGLWHERAYWNTTRGKYERHRSDNHAFAYGTHVVGDYVTGKLYSLDSDTYTDNGDEIRWMRIAPHLSQSQKRVSYNSFELEMEVGVGLSGISQGINPKVMLQYSNDGGFTWSNEKWKDAGKTGKRKTRLIWRRLGSSRNRVFKIMGSDPVKTILIGAEIEPEVMTS